MPAKIYISFQQPPFTSTKYRNRIPITFFVQSSFDIPFENYALNIANRDLVDEEEDLVEEADLCFLCFCFFGILGMSVGGILNMSDAVCRPNLSPKSVPFIQERKKEA